MSKFYSALKLARHVSDLIGPSSGAFCTSCVRRQLAQNAPDDGPMRSETCKAKT